MSENKKPIEKDYNDVQRIIDAQMERICEVSHIDHDKMQAEQEREQETCNLKKLFAKLCRKKE